VGWSSCWAPGFSLCFGWNAWSTSWLYAPLVYQPAPPPVVIVRPPVVVLATPDQAWGLLAAGFDSEAMEQFATLESVQPGNPANTVGYALSQAMLGFSGSAAVAMREALRDRAEALLLVPSDPNLRGRIADLAAQLQSQSRALPATTPAGRDALFLLACMQTILYDNANAYFSISRLIDQGDLSPASFNLKAMLTIRLQG